MRSRSRSSTATTSTPTAPRRGRPTPRSRPNTGLSVTDVTNELAWARRAFREIVLDTLRGLCATDEEFRAEARDLLGVAPK